MRLPCVHRQRRRRRQLPCHRLQLPCRRRHRCSSRELMCLLPARGRPATPQHLTAAHCAASPVACNLRPPSPLPHPPPPPQPAAALLPLLRPHWQRKQHPRRRKQRQIPSLWLRRRAKSLGTSTWPCACRSRYCCFMNATQTDLRHFVQFW